jgi:hypothetical protein
MRLASITTALLIAGIAPLLAEDGHPDVLKGPNDARWGAAPPALPKGVQLAVSSGDPAKNGPFVVRLKLPANTKGHSREHHRHIRQVPSRHGRQARREECDRL